MTTSSTPTVTVLMPVYNGRRFLGEAVESILRQSFEDFEFLILDDASTDGAGEDLAAINDPRVRLVRNDTNLGITPTLNRGLDLARGRYIARMDADDIAEPVRLRTQLHFLNTHPDIGIVGSSRTIIDESGATIAIGQAPATDSEIRWKCLLGNPFAHPTVMIRREVIERYRMRYDAEFVAAEDYEMWTRLLAVTRGANVSQPLLRYRLRDGISRTSKPEQLATHDRVAYQAIRNLLPCFAEITPMTVRELRGRFGGFSVREEGMSPSDQPWADVYARMRRNFEQRYISEAA